MKVRLILVGMVIMASMIFGISGCGGGGTSTPAAPTPPTGVTAVAADGQVTISWNAVSGATSYNLYWSVISDITIDNSTKISDVRSAYVHKILANTLTYYYVVTAVSPDGESGMSAKVSATPTVATTAPSAPEGVTASAGDEQTAIGWNAVSGATSYNIYWSTTSGVTKSDNKITDAAIPYSHTGLTNETTYYYVVAAENALGESGISTEVSATPTAKTITAFRFTTPAATGTINEATHTIAVTVPFGTNVTSLTPTITYSGASISPASGVAQNFTNPVTYTVTATDSSTQAYTVTVKVAATASGFKDVDLVFSKGGADLCGMKADGSGKVILKAATTFDAYDYFSDMDFSADGKYMAYTASCGGNGFIRVMGSDLGNPTDLTTRCSGGDVYSASSPAFSPDGTKIAFIGSYYTATEKGNFLSIMNADGSNAHRVSPLAIDSTLPGDGYYNPDERSPSFSADGTLIVFSTNRGGGSQLATIKLDGSGMQLFGGCTAPDGGCYATDPIPFDPTVDRSTNTIYYSSAQPDVLNGEPNIYHISLAGTDKSAPLTNSVDHPLYRPSVSPDGSKVAFTQVIDFSDANIMLLDLNTMVVTDISDPAFSTYSDDPVFVRR